MGKSVGSNNIRSDYLQIPSAGTYGNVPIGGIHQQNGSAFYSGSLVLSGGIQVIGNGNFSSEVNFQQPVYNFSSVENRGWITNYGRQTIGAGGFIFYAYSNSDTELPGWGGSWFMPADGVIVRINIDSAPSNYPGIMGDPIGNGSTLRCYVNASNRFLAIRDEGSSNSVPSSRYRLGGRDIILRPDEAIWFLYNSIVQRWIPIGIPAAERTQTIAKTADESVVNSTVLQDDDQLFFTAQANKTYAIDIGLMFVGNGTYRSGGLRFNLQFPSFRSPHTMAVISGLDPYSNGVRFLYADTTGNTGIQLGAIAGQNEIVPLLVQCVLSTGSTGGTVRVRWAQQTADTAGATVGAGSYLTYKLLD